MFERAVKVSLSASMLSYQKGMQDAAAATREVGKEGEKLAQMREAYDGIGRGAIVMGGLIATGVGVAIGRFAEFDAAMSNVQAATHESTGNMGLLRDAAIEAGASTVFSATEAAGAIEELAKAGVSTADIMAGGLAGSLDLAAAGELGVARAAEITSTALNQFGLDGGQASHVADVLAAGAGKAMGSVEDLANGLKFVGPVAASMGVSLEETTGVLSLFAQQGIIGEQAGTSLRGVLSSLTAPSSQARGEIERLGLTLYDSNGKFLGLKNAAGQLSNAYMGMDDASRQASMGIIFGRETITAATALYQAGADGVAEYTAAVDDTGYAAETARLRLNNLNGDLEALGGALDSALIQTGSSANDTLRAMVQSLTFLAEGYGDLPDPVQAATLAIGVGTAAVLLFGGTAVATVPKVLQWKASVDAAGISLSGVAVKAGIAGLAVAGFTTVIGFLISKQAEAQAKAEAYADTLDDVTGEVTKSSREMAKEALAVEQSWLGFSRGSAFDAAKKLSLNLDTVTDAASGSVDALNELDTVLRAGQGDTQAAARLADELGISLTDVSAASTLVSNSVLGEAGSLEKAKEMARQKAEADRNSADASDVSAAAAEVNADALDGLAGKAQGAAFDIDELSDAILGFGSAQLDAREAARSLEEAVANLRTSVEENGTTLDITTEAGRRNEAALDAIAEAALKTSAATLVQTGSQEEASAAISRGRDQLIRALEQLGITGQAAEDYADKLGLIPSNVTTAFTASTTDAEQKAQRLLDIVNSLPRERRINVVMTMPNGAPVSDRQLMDQFGFASENGNLFEGGRRVLAFENGGLPSGMYAGADRPLYKFAEKATIWESFISGKPSERDRNIKIWEATGDRLGASRGGSVSATQVAVTAQFPDQITIMLEDGTPLRGFVQKAASDVVRKTYDGYSGGMRG